MSIAERLPNLRQDQIRIAGGHDQDVGKQRELRQIASLGVADAYRGLVLHQH